MNAKSAKAIVLELFPSAWIYECKRHERCEVVQDRGPSPLLLGDGCSEEDAWNDAVYHLGLSA